MTHGEVDINAIQREAYEQGLKDGLKEPRSSCACGGAKVLARGPVRVVPYVAEGKDMYGLVGEDWGTVNFEAGAWIPGGQPFNAEAIILEGKPCS